MSFAQRTQILCLGDSMTEWGDSETGWLTILRCKYSRRADFVNRGYAGFTTSMILEKVVPLLIKDGKTYDVGIVFLGANDVRTFFDLTRFSSNLERLSMCLSGRLCRKLFFVSPPATKMADLVTYSNYHVEKYVNALRTHCNSNGGTFVDLFSRFTGDLLCDDGLHPNKEGNLHISQVIEYMIDPYIQKDVDVEWYVHHSLNGCICISKDELE